MNASTATATGFPLNAALNHAVAASTQRKASLRLLPVIGVGYCLAYVDRVNISFASLQMNRYLHFSATTYSIGAGLFFIGYAFCEVPSNLMMLRYGARKWLGLLKRDSFRAWSSTSPFGFQAVRGHAP